MKLKKLHDPEHGILRVVGLMSGSGTNLRKILEHEEALRKKEGSSPYNVVAIFSDNHASCAAEIGRDYNLPVIIRDIKAYYQAHGLPRRDLALRAGFDRETVEVLSCFKARCAVYAGYMSIASGVLTGAFLGVNVHPADLSVTVNGKRRWVGDHTVLEAIKAGEKTICSTTHLIEPEVDGGRILMISRPLEVQIPSHKNIENPMDVKEIARNNQERLKKEGDWVIFPKTIEYLSRGFYETDTGGNLYYNGRLIPSGLRL
jgi:folate-dependent phosphoribosylglycinamide formyltransferase PurN